MSDLARAILDDDDLANSVSHCERKCGAQTGEHCTVHQNRWSAIDDYRHVVRETLGESEEYVENAARMENELENHIQEER